MTVSTRARNVAVGVRKRVRKRTLERFTDAELRQLRSLTRAYDREDGPELLVFGDSAMFFTTSLDDDRRHLADLVADELGGVRYEALVGPGYHARIVSAFLTVLERSRSRPRAVVVPTSVLMATRLFLEHPQFAYVLESAAIRERVAAGDTSLSGLPRPGDEALEDYDRLPAPSLYGARRTAGEIRLIVNSVPQTRWQKAVRMRHLMDYYNAERLEPDSPGVRLVGDLGRQLAGLGIPSVAYVAPVNHEVLRTTLGDGAVEQLAHNASLLERAFADATAGTGKVANAVMDCPSAEFVDPVHLTHAGRVRLAGRIAGAVAL